jgi:hypothetical protein
MLTGLNRNRLLCIGCRNHSIPLTLKEATSRLEKVGLIVDQQQVEWFGERCKYHTDA